MLKRTILLGYSYGGLVDNMFVSHRLGWGFDS